MDTVSEFHAEATHATVSEGLAQGPYMAARAGFDPRTLRTKGDEFTNDPPLHIGLIMGLVSVDDFESTKLSTRSMDSIPLTNLIAFQFQPTVLLDYYRGRLTWIVAIFECIH